MPHVIVTNPAYCLLSVVRVLITWKLSFSCWYQQYSLLVLSSKNNKDASKMMLGKLVFQFKIVISCKESLLLRDRLWGMKLSSTWQHPLEIWLQNQIMQVLHNKSNKELRFKLLHIYFQIHCLSFHYDDVTVYCLLVSTDEFGIGSCIFHYQIILFILCYGGGPFRP